MRLRLEEERVIEALWIKNVEEGAEYQKDDNVDILQDLTERGLVQEKGQGIWLTDKGREVARGVVRRHRLGERLFVDLLEEDQGDFRDVGCPFNHVLDEGTDERICTLLGHPPVCPHGRDIPKGRCCEEGRSLVTPLVTSLSDMKVGQRGVVAYLRTSEKRRLQKLLTMGVLPGQKVQLIQRFPAYVFDVGRTQIAVDSEIADDIFVRVNE